MAKSESPTLLYLPILDTEIVQMLRSSHQAAVCFLQHMLRKWFKHDAETCALQKSCWVLSPSSLWKSSQQKATEVLAQYSVRAGRHLMMGMVIESSWCGWLLACCALLDSHFLTNLTCVAFCYPARMQGWGMVDYSLNVKCGYCLSLLFLRYP